MLGVSASSTRSAILSAYRLRARMMHPDRHVGRPESEVRLATQEFQRLTAARDVLTAGEASMDESRRAAESTRHVVPLTVSPLIAADGGIVEIRSGAGVPLSVRIPAAVSDGTVLRVPDRDVDAGYRYVRIAVQRDDLDDFERFVQAREAADWSNSGSRGSAARFMDSEKKAVWPVLVGIVGAVAAGLAIVSPVFSAGIAFGILAVVISVGGFAALGTRENGRGLALPYALISIAFLIGVSYLIIAVITLSV